MPKSQFFPLRRHDELRLVQELAKHEGMTLTAKLYQLVERELQSKGWQKGTTTMPTLAEKVYNGVIKQRRTKFGRNTDYIADAQKVAKVILETRRIKLPNGTIQKGSQLIGKLIKKFPEDEDPHARINHVLDWYALHHSDNQYVPKFASFKEFVNKFVHLEEAIERSKHQTNGHHINGHHVNGHHINGHGAADLSAGAGLGRGAGGRSYGSQ